MTTILTQVPRVEEFVLSEANGFMSRDEVTVTLGVAAYKSGTVMSKLTATGTCVPYDDVGTDGSETAAGILYTALPAGTGDVKYHDFFKAEDKMMICDIGHYESEQFVTQQLFEILSEKFPKFAVSKSTGNTNPVNYFL